MEATFQSILHLLAWNGYENEAYKGSMVCKETWEDDRILFPNLINKTFGYRKSTLIGINVYYNHDEKYGVERKSQLTSLARWGTVSDSISQRYLDYTFNEEYALKRIKRLVKLGAKIDIEDLHGFTPLVGACIRGDNHNMSIFKYLIEQGANIDCEEMRSSWNPLSLLAADCGIPGKSGVEKINILLKHGANINKLNQNQSVLYMTCVHNESKDDTIIHLLCKNGANVHVLNYDGETVIEECLRLGKVQFAEALLAYGAVMPEDSMEKAIWRKQEETVKFLQKYGHVIPDDALRDAIHTSSPDIVRMLLRCNVCPNKLIDENPPLFHALDGPTNELTVQIVKHLCAAGADVNAQMKHQTYQLNSMEAKGNKESILTFIIRDYIVYKNKYVLECIKLFLEKGAKPPQASSYSSIYPYYKDPLEYKELNRMLLAARMRRV
jgi:ankyrin repeat protein